jgi:hypothetical protein
MSGNESEPAVDGVRGENMETALEDRGVVGNGLQGVVGAEENSSFKVDGARCSLRLVLFSLKEEGLSEVESELGAEITDNAGRACEASESDRDRL